MEEKRYSGRGYHGGGRKPTGLRRVTFCVSCQPEERDEIRRIAKESGKSVSAFLVEAALGKKGQSRPVDIPRPPC